MEVMQSAMAEDQEAVEEIGVDQSTIQIITLDGWLLFFKLNPRCKKNSIK